MYEYQGLPYCFNHHAQATNNFCSRCNEPLAGMCSFTQALAFKYTQSKSSIRNAGHVLNAINP
jgi:hypothetical protein